MEKDNKLIDPNTNSEKLISDNKELYIKLNESDNHDVTEAFFNFSKSM
jgi:hypothetical protein